MKNTDNDKFKYYNLMGTPTEQTNHYLKLKDDLEFQKFFMIYDFSYHLKEKYNISLVLDFTPKTCIDGFCFIIDNTPVKLIEVVMTESAYHHIKESNYSEHFQILLDMHFDLSERMNKKFELIQYPVDNSLKWLSIIEILLDRKDISNKFLASLLDKSTFKPTQKQFFTKL